MGNPVVANAHLLVHPSLEWLTNNGVDDVGEVATTQLGDLLAGGQNHLDLLVVLGELEDALDGEALELGHINVLDVVAVDDGLDAHSKVSEVPNRHSLKAWDVCFDLGGEEAIDFYIGTRVRKSALGKMESGTYPSYSGTWRQRPQQI